MQVKQINSVTMKKSVISYKQKLQTNQQTPGLTPTVCIGFTTKKLMELRLQFWLATGIWQKH